MKQKAPPVTDITEQSLRYLVKECAKDSKNFKNLFDYVGQSMLWAYKVGYFDGGNDPKPIKIRVIKDKK